MLKHIALFLIAVFAIAQEPSIFDMMGGERSEKVIKKAPLQTIAPTNEPEINISETQIYQTVEPSQLIITTSNIPKEVYAGEIFKFGITANTQSNIVVDIKTTVLENENLKWLNKNLQWENIGNGIYKSEIFLEANSTEQKNTKITINLKRNGEFFQTANTTINLPSLKQIKSDQNYSHIVANSLEIKKHKTNKFDDKNLIMIVELVGKNTNITDFWLNDPAILKQGVDSVSGNFNSHSGFYFAIFTPEKTSLDFSYFNLKNKKLESFSLPVIVEDDEISTQIGLNPKQSKFEIYKDTAGYILLATSFILFLIKRNSIFLVLTLIFGAYGIYSYNPLGNAVLKKNVSIKILPTQNSSIFFTTENEEKVEILGERKEFKKVLLNDGKVGWVLKDDIIKN
ncbi:SH3 domain-containing protein [Campylobacter sp. RM16190]|uniref:SH3 domain-containing protein n=1 Tax=Campylobacter sp. RM16190 TaxID=1705727 RepID=UPI001475C39E|nr:SH3 domain-containing protein [Campylobacter sp. RM16190]